MKVLILGIGSPFGDDRLGWVVAEALQNSSALAAVSPPVTIAVLDRPGTMLLTHWRDADSVILIDAVYSGATPGTLHRRSADDLPAGKWPSSSHGFGVASAIALARALGEMPARLLLHGIEIDPGWRAGGLSAAASRALPVLVATVEKEALALACP